MECPQTVSDEASFDHIPKQGDGIAPTLLSLSTFAFTAARAPSPSCQVRPGNSPFSSRGDNKMLQCWSTMAMPQTAVVTSTATTPPLLSDEHALPEDAYDEAESVAGGSCSTSTSADSSEWHYGQQIDDTDWTWSISSNAFFFLGCLSYWILSTWDAVLWYDPAIQLHYQTNDDSAPYVPRGQVYYNMLSFLAPVVYVLNSVVDIGWAQQIRRRNQVKRRRRMKRLQQMEAAPNMIAAAAANTHCKYNPSSASSSRAKRLAKRIRKRLRRIRKHAAHRRELLAATWFGIAAVTGLLDVVLVSQTDFFDTVSVHCYVLSAIFAISGRRTRPWNCCVLDWYNNMDNLEDWGDIYFLVGSCVDMILCDFHFDDAVRWWPVLSSTLWVIDACLYLRSDAVTLQHVWNTSDQDSWTTTSTLTSAAAAMPPPTYIQIADVGSSARS